MLIHSFWYQVWYYQMVGLSWAWADIQCNISCANFLLTVTLYLTIYLVKKSPIPSIVIISYMFNTISHNVSITLVWNWSEPFLFTILDHRHPLVYLNQNCSLRKFHGVMTCQPCSMVYHIHELALSTRLAWSFIWPGRSWHELDTVTPPRMSYSHEVVSVYGGV